MSGPERGKRGSRFPEDLRFLYLVFLPLAGCAAIKLSGTSMGHGWGLGIGIGLFLYHYLLWALHETEKLDWHRAQKDNLAVRWTWLISPLIVSFTVDGSWTDWLVEQTLLETGAFSAAVALLALRKCYDEGKDAPWFLAILVFVAPTLALLVKLGLFWISRRERAVGWEEGLFLVAAAIALGSIFRRLRPYILGRDQLMEPLSTSRKTVLAVVWLVGLLVGGILLGS